MNNISQKISGVLKNTIFVFFLALIVGYMILPKGFPKLKFDIGSFPLYITEIFILLSIISLIVIVILNRLRIGKFYFFSLFLFFFAILLAGLSIGFFNYRDVSFILRQSTIFYYGLFYLIIFYLFDDLKKLRIFLLTVIVCSNLLIFLILIRYLGFGVRLFGEEAIKLMTGGHYFPIAILLVLEINLVELVRKRYLKALLLINIIILIVLSIVDNVRGNWIALFAAFIFSFIISGNKKKLLINILIILGILVILAVAAWPVFPDIFKETVNELQSLKNFFMGTGDSQTIASINTNWRVITWKGFLSEFTEKPVTGWGFGKKFLAEETFDLGWNTGLADNWVSTHNYLISFLYMTGIFGLISFLFIVVYYFIENIRFLKKAESSRDKSITRGLLSCVFYILILGLFEVVLEIPYQGVFFWVFFSFGIIILKNSGHRFLYNENTTNT